MLAFAVGFVDDSFQLEVHLRVLKNATRDENAMKPLTPCVFHHSTEAFELSGGE